MSAPGLLPPLTVHRMLTTELVLAAVALVPVLLVTYGVAPDASYRPGPWFAALLLLASAVGTGTVVRRVRRTFGGPWATSVRTGQLTGDVEADRSAVYLLERHARHAHGAAISATTLAAWTTFLAVSSFGSPRWWAVVAALASVAVAGITLSVTRPGARAKATRTQYQRGWMPPLRTSTPGH